uniref:Centrosomal protein of 70 kDa n=1 Tax=Oryzias sinensis TaxID=183150 RepID=A0A8C7Y059_9TELE
VSQEQQAEWEPLNRLLQQRGFRPVLFADPVENKNPAELGLLDRKSAAALRRTLETLLADSDRRQALLQELVGSNNRLREEVQEQMSRAAQHSQKASELQALLDQVKVKVQDLEDRCICRAAQTHSRTLQLQRHSAERRCEQLQQKLRRKEEEAAKLRWKLRFAVEQEERRLARRNRSFQEISPLLRSLSQLHSDVFLLVLPSPPSPCFQLLSDITAVIGSPAPFKEAESELADFQALLPVLEDWAGQRRLLKVWRGSGVSAVRMCRCVTLRCLQDLRDLLVDLSGRPRDDSAAAVKVEDLIVLVQDMLENKLRSSTPYTLSAIVSHFQKLFDVTSLRGVYPRMNEVYTRLAEMTNAMRNLKEALDLGSSDPVRPVSTCSSRVALCRFRSSRRSSSCSVILKVKQHDEFLPAFHRLVTDILQTLGEGEALMFSSHY